MSTPNKLAFVTQIEPIVENILREKNCEKKKWQSLSNADVAEFAREMDGHEIKESCWDVFVFFGEPSIGIGGSACIVFSIILTCIGNFLFLYVLLFTKETFVQQERPTSETLRTWRYTIGHAHKNMLASQSLVSAVCDGTQLLIQASEQSQLAQDIEAYGVSVSSGIMLALLVILLWFLTVLGEVEEACNFAAGVRRLHMPRELPESGERPESSSQEPIRRSSTSSTLLRASELRKAGSFSLEHSEQDGKIAFHALSRPIIALNLLVCLVRVVFAIVLFVVGAFWLANTLNVENLVLNAAALEFVMTLDELVYKAIVPDLVKALRNNAVKLPPPPADWQRYCKCTVSGIDPAPVFRFGLAMLALTGFFVGVLYPQQVEIRTLHETLCGGDLEFVDIEMEYFPQVAQTKIDDAEDLVVRTAEFKINFLEKYAKLNGTQPTWLKYAEMQTAVDAGALSLYPRKCQDSNDLRNVKLRSDVVDFVEFFQAYAGNDRVDSCGALQSMCRYTTAFWIRFLCPQTCGCDEYRGTLWIRTGCPQTCEETVKYRQEETSLECKDSPSAELRNDPTWIKWWVGNWSPWYAAQWEGFETNEVPDCKVLAASNLEAGALPQLLCAYGDSARFSGNLRLFCPTTCGCQNGDEGCPSSCSTIALRNAIGSIFPNLTAQMPGKRRLQKLNVTVNAKS
eukprot:TRINITY_DN92034_c0_g1_i1.p1 TRINITY_DN92034_c0_g1~~TRINITY_DN92034_c0_g1_i1.p1  ORF type:complete len:795 (+),score=110.54 TRINITY_DN92034_c0_g1_i1:341-2386(+)